MRLFSPARSRAALVVAASLIASAGCGSAPDGEEASSITLVDGWIKATDDDMTSMFGVLHNSGDTPATLTAAGSADAELVELHTIVDDGKGNLVMTAVEDGFAIDAGGEFTMEPGGDHIMLMELTATLEPGEDIEVDLTFDDGSTAAVTVPAKEFSGADEDYGHDDEGDD